MRADRHSLALLVLGACGRIAFDPIVPPPEDGGVDADGDGGLSPFVYVQGSTSTTPSATEVEASLVGQTAGNLNVLVIGIAGPLTSVTSVTDDAGNTYERAIGPTSSGALAQWIYTARITAAPAMTTVHVTFDGVTTQPGLLFAEYAGVSTTMAVHTTSGLAGSGTLSASGPVTVTIAPALIIGANTNAQGGTAGPGAGYTQRLFSAFEDILEDRVVETPGTYVADAPLTTDHGWVMQAIVLAPIP